MSRYYDGWAPYVPVAQRRAKAAKKLDKLRKKGLNVQAVEIIGRKIADSFWGKGWCDHMESFSDYENRLPRGRTYVRNGSVCHLDIQPGRVEAIVSGSELYNIAISIAPLAKKKWDAVKAACAGRIGSLIDLLRGKLAGGVMEVVSHRENGLFPLPGEIKFTCDCPDSARMCKHIAAVLYGVGARLDHTPEKLFLLRGVSHEELVDVSAAVRVATGTATSRRRIDATGLGDVFGIDMADADETMRPAPRKKVASPDVTKTSPKGSLPAGKKDAKKPLKGTRPGKTLKPALKRKKAALAPVEEPFPRPLTGAAIRAWREALRETQAAFAARLSVTAASISNWEKRGRQTLGVRDATLASLQAAWKLTRGLK
jgi:uncharacterized Zn finger protein/DNA-binding transcriptional regulator YiaG